MVAFHVVTVLEKKFVFHYGGHGVTVLPCAVLPFAVDLELRYVVIMPEVFVGGQKLCQ